MRDTTMITQTLLTRQSSAYSRVAFNHPPPNIFGPETIPQRSERSGTEKIRTGDRQFIPRKRVPDIPRKGHPKIPRRRNCQRRDGARSVLVPCMLKRSTAFPHAQHKFGNRKIRDFLKSQPSKLSEKIANQNQQRNKLYDPNNIRREARHRRAS
jgi:hypothetical protein